MNPMMDWYVYTFPAARLVSDWPLGRHSCLILQQSLPQ